ncbi:MAG: cytidylate kinase-like family protein [Candidatus Dormiibacterota bacterium]
MSTVTIAATYGAGGSLIAPKVAEQLGLRMIDRAFGRAAASEFAEPLQEEMLENDELHESRLTTILSRAMSVSGLWVGVPLAPEEVGFDDRIMATEKALRLAANREGAVILGRAGVFVLAERPDVLHVRVDGPKEARVRQAMWITHADEPTARRQLKENDAARHAYIDHFYPHEGWQDPANYHLMLDSTAIAIDACVEIIVAAARSRFAHPQ